MHRKYIATIVTLLIINLFLAWQVYAQVEPQGMLDSPDTPENTHTYRLEDIYNRLDSGATGMPSAFTEPSSGPTTGTGHTLDEVMAQAPAADNTNGANPGEVLIGKTYWSLRTDGTWGPQTGTAPVAAVPQTGQTASSVTGDDGDLKKGVAWPTPRFTNNGDGTVTDNLTGLVWLKDAKCTDFSTWENAVAFARSLEEGTCGLNDGSQAGEWRLPNVRELSSLTDFSQSDPAVSANADDFFDNVQSLRYWSSTTTVSTLQNPIAWLVDMESGRIISEEQALSRLVWPVRDKQ